MSQHRILIPVDFTPVSTNAMNHAIAVGKALKSELHLLHIVGKKSEFGEAKSRLGAFAEKHAVEFDGDMKTTVRIGHLFDDIDDVSVEMDANLVIMGTHGLKGMQFITGGRALKIVRECSVPFIITQSRPIRETGYDDIVVPLDLNQDTKQKLAIVAEMATYFKGRVHIISPAESDEFLQNQLRRNVEFASDYFEDRGIEYTTKISEHDSGAFVKDVVRYAASFEADLISIMNFHERSLMGILGTSYEQQIITNEAEIPVLVLNPFETRIIRQTPFSF
ncbi:MAG: universal stress protein [Bacteroidota bacterium]|nr:universal stress protein [Bacteroidota bacterium]